MVTGDIMEWHYWNHIQDGPIQKKRKRKEKKAKHHPNSVYNEVPVYETLHEKQTLFWELWYDQFSDQNINDVVFWCFHESCSVELIIATTNLNQIQFWRLGATLNHFFFLQLSQIIEMQNYLLDEDEKENLQGRTVV